MSVTVRPTTRGFVHVHRAALTIVILSIAFAVAVGLLTARLLSDSTPAPASSVSTVHVGSTDDGCQMAKPAQPC
jgi:hypothetical protein